MMAQRNFMDGTVSTLDPLGADIDRIPWASFAKV
jgi:hypothetical protein